MRRFLRALGLLGAGLVALVLAGWLGLRLWALHVVRTAVPEFEARHGSLDRSQWHRDMPPPSENGGQYLRAATLLVDNTFEEWRRWKEAVARAQGEPAGDAARADFAAVLGRNRAALDLVREAATKRDCVFNGDLPALDEKAPNLIALLDLARIERELAREELAGSSPRDGTNRLIELLRVADCLERDPVVVVFLIGSAVERAALRDLRSELAAGRVDGALASLAPNLEPASYPTIAERIRIEAAMFQPGPWWRGRFGSMDRLDSPANPVDVEGFRGAVTVRAAAEALETLEAPAPPPLVERGGWSVRAVEMFFMNVYRPFWTYERTARAQAAVRALARATVAVRERGLAEGKYPSSLDELGAGFGEPTPLAREAIRYEVAADGSARLSLPASAKEWRRIADLLALEAPGRSNYPGRFDFEWTLPPLPAGGATVPPRD